MISHFFHVLHDSKSIKREASAAAFIRVLLQPRWIALEKKKKTAIILWTNISTVLRADYLPLAFSHLQLRRLCVRNIVPLPLTSR